MWKPVRDREKEAERLVTHFAAKGIQKELDKINKKITKMSDKLFLCNYNNSTAKRRQNMRTNLSLECEQRDRLQYAMKLCGRLYKEER